MKRIAVDIVLLPAAEAMDIAIKANRELLRQCRGEIELNRHDCLPHVSLAMGCVEEDKTDGIRETLVTIAEKYPLRFLNFVGFHTEINSAGRQVTVALLERVRALQALHEEVMAKMTPFFSYDATQEMLLSQKRVSESTLSWIRNYPRKSSYERFSPHITIGYGVLENYPFPGQIAVSKLAVCHLGNHCTCRKVLASVPMQKE